MLSAIAWTRKAPVTSAMSVRHSVCLSVGPRISALPPLGEFCEHLYVMLV